MADDAHTMQCSEVWGGNDEVDRGVAMPGLDAWVWSRPCAGDAAGGDIHYVSSCATGRITRILLADVAGHGLEVAPLALRLRAVMRRFVNYIDQTRLVGLINREFAAFGAEGRFATVLVATFWGPSGDLDITNAGHPTPLVYRADRRIWELLSVTRNPAAEDTPLGVLDEATYARTSMRLRPDDLVLLYTDALPEARTADGAMLGESGLISMLNELGRPSPETLVSTLHGRVCERVGSSSLSDDATLMLLRLNSGTAPKGSLRMGLRAIREFISEVGQRVTGRLDAIAWPQSTPRLPLGAFFDRFNRR